MVKIVICDDDVNELDKTNKMCQAYLAGHPEADIRISSFSSPLELKLNIEGGEKYDIFLLDIYMPQMTGTELAKYLRRSKEDCQIIFLTTSVNHAIEAFSLHAAHYLVKPFTREQLADALNKAVRAIDKKNNAQITVKTSDGIRRISFSDFIYSETDNHTQQIYLADGECYRVRIPSTELFELLSFDSRFFKCGSTYIINVGKVEEITRKHIVLETAGKIPMQRRQYKDLIDRYTAYALEGI
jgi:DNA-binding LytR/AlgR family response regulator